MKNIPELLAPAGGIEQLMAAIENGADAVYMGGKTFNARMNADNFGEHELQEAIEHAHVRGVNIYIAMNTLIADDEIKAALAYAEKLYLMGLDALIIQDIGLASLIKRYMPELPIHFSTQGTIFNLEGVKAAEKMGFERVILARELGIAEIGEICSRAEAQIEVFVHGALCICYSGQCELSYAIGGRSGNRGTCAQPCRLPYDLERIDRNGRESVVTSGAYLLSPKDLAAVSLIGSLADAGAASLKIEGRMKSPEYVAIVTRIYRKYLDLWAKRNGMAGNIGIYNGSIPVDTEDERALSQIFSRGSFTTGYLSGNPGKKLMSGELPKHQGIRIGSVRSASPDKRQVEIVLEDRLSIGDGIEIMNRELPGNIVTMMRIGGIKADFGTKGDTVTVGYIDGHIMPGDRVNKISDKELAKAARASYTGRQRRQTGLTGTFTLEKHAPARLVLEDGIGHIAEVTGEKMPEEAINLPLTQEMVQSRLSKTGGTPFFLESIDIRLEPGLSLPAAELNDIRRSALERMEALRKIKYANRRPIDGFEDIMPGQSFEMPEARLSNTAAASFEAAVKSTVQSNDLQQIKKSLYFYRLDQDGDGRRVNKAFEKEIFDVQRIYLPYDCFLTDKYDDIFQAYSGKGVELVPVIPAITRGRHDEIIRGNLDRLGSHRYAYGICAGNPGWANRCADEGMAVFGDHSLNLYNSYSFGCIKSLGLAGGVVSHEIRPDKIKGMNFYGLAAEYAVYGRIPVMVSEHCVAGDWGLDADREAICRECISANFRIRDRKGERYPVITDRSSCRMTVLSCSKRCELNAAKGLEKSGITYARMYIYDENEEEIKKL